MVTSAYQWSSCSCMFCNFYRKKKKERKGLALHQLLPAMKGHSGESMDIPGHPEAGRRLVSQGIETRLCHINIDLSIEFSSFKSWMLLTLLSDAPVVQVPNDPFFLWKNMVTFKVAFGISSSSQPVLTLPRSWEEKTGLALTCGAGLWASSLALSWNRIGEHLWCTNNVVGSKPG